MTQQEIVDYVNRLTVGYHIDWWGIQYDADKAILKINAFLGTNYPPMSKILIDRNSTYSLISNGKRRDIFPDTYIITVVIPFIAMEVLARDEEFTTVYNKYAQDVEDGLFTMFQNEYNRVPQCFRQSKDIGVFFEKDSYACKFQPNSPYIEDNHKHNNFTFKVNYHYNLEGAIITEQIYDEHQYEYGTTVPIKSPTKKVYSSDGLYIYEFKGYTYDKDDYTFINISEGITNISSDIDLYMHWSRIDLFTINSNGVFSVSTSDTLDNLEHLVVPVAMNGILVKEISTSLFNNIPNIKSVKLPETITTIKENTFNNFKGYVIELSEPMAQCTLEKNSFNLTNSKVSELVIPVRYVPSGTDTIFSGSDYTIKFRALKENTSYVENNFSNTLKKEWGYNG